MARSFVSDPMLSCNFALIDVPMAGVIPLAFPYKVIKSALSNAAFIGMKSISIPAMTLETKEIREGNWPYVHSVHSGYTSGGDCVITQAVLPISLDMYQWFLQGVWGRIGPRRHFMVAHLRQDKSLPARVIWLQGCIPVSWKASSDFDALSSEVCVEELTIKVDRIEVIPIPTEDTINGA